MPNVITLKNGQNEVIFDEDDFIRLVDEHMGFDARRWLEDYLIERDDDTDYAAELEDELKGEKEHHKEVIKELRKQSEVIAGLISEKDIDRKALSNAAGLIGTITWREMNG